MKTQMVCVCWYDSFHHSLYWASSCNNTAASRLLLSCHSAAIATTCQSQAHKTHWKWLNHVCCASEPITLQNKKLFVALWFVSHVKLFCRTWKSARLSAKSLWGLRCLLSVSDKRDALTIGFMLLLLSFILLHLMFCNCKLFVALCFMQMSNLF